MPRQSGTFGRYEILAEVGRGGMGTVYRARDSVLDRVVALKTMTVDVAAEPRMRERFLREARSAARLQHPNIVTIYDFGEVEGTPFIAMEFLTGDDLSDAVEHGRLVSLASRLDVVIQVCAGLGFAHRHGVVHRDVKPPNVAVLPDGTVKVVDFGIAWIEDATMATRTGQLLGTPSYMAPEQFSGAPTDHRVDIWAVGVILYELATGRRPFSGSTVPSLIYQIVNAPPPAIDLTTCPLPKGLVAIIERALAKTAGERFANLEAMGRALREVAAGVTTAMPMPAGAERTPVPSAVRDPTPIAAAARDAAAAPPAAQPTARPARVASLLTPLPRQGGFVENGIFGEERRVQVILASPDDTVLAVGGTDGSIRLWDLATRMKLATLRNRLHLRTGHGSLTTALAFSADGALLASGHLDGAIYLWEVETGLELDVRMGHEGAVGGLAIPSDGRVLISGGADATLKFWDLAAARTRDARREIRRQPDAITCLALAGSESMIASGHTNRSIRVHAVADHRLTATLHGHKAPLSSIVASPAGDVLASGARDGSVRVHDLASREERARFQEHRRAVACLAFFPGGRRLAAAAMDSAVVVLDLDEPETPIALQGSADDHFASVSVSRDGRCIVCATAEGRLRVWRV